MYRHCRKTLFAHNKVCDYRHQAIHAIEDDDDLSEHESIRKDTAFAPPY
jgi:hypothetical protein